MAPTDYKERSTRSKQNRSKPARPAETARRGVGKKAGHVVRWRWFGAGLCVGAVASAALFLYEPSVVRQVVNAGGVVTGQANDPPRTRFEFYTLLTEKEMFVPDSEIGQPAAAAPLVKNDAPRKDVAPVPAVAAAAPASAQRDQYILQVGSFRKLEDADRLKAKLAFLGLEGSIQTISIDGKETWHRVRVGPYFARVQLDEARATLKVNKYDVLLLKLKGQ
ncbi:MAG: cell division protein FtsN [Gammaproteobacteria bacterium]|jgi:cell division protein FtsN